MHEELDSVLCTVRVSCGLESDDDSFDNELILFTNSVFSTLHQMGVGPKKPFKISSDEEQWNDFMNNDERLEMVKTFVGEKVRLIFDPPSSSYALESLKAIVKEDEWRLYILSQTVEEEVEDESN